MGWKVKTIQVLGSSEPTTEMSRAARGLISRDKATIEAVGGITRIYNTHSLQGLCY